MVVRPSISASVWLNCAVRYATSSLLLGLVMLSMVARTGRAQQAEDTSFGDDVAVDVEEDASSPWIAGPTTAPIGNMASLQLSDQYQYVGPADAQALMRQLENPVSGGELAIVVPAAEGSWFVLFEFSDVGYVKDDEREELDADAILESIRTGTEQANEERARNGWAELNIVGWEHPPKYDETSNNLEWAIRGESEGQPVVNYNTRILGRHGVMEANLVVDPESLPSVLPEYKQMLAGFRYNPGSTYGEFREGDKVAEYGLTALIAGGAAAVAFKTGLFKKFGKLIVVAVAAIAAAFKKLFGIGRRTEAE